MNYSAKNTFLMFIYLCIDGEILTIHIDRCVSCKLHWA